jgi:hypothetical protein
MPYSGATISDATISRCGLHRYQLHRIWGDPPYMVFVMQNPSTADAREDDPTIRRCIRFAKREGCGGISVRNVFALRATDEKELLTHADPVGPKNIEYLERIKIVAPESILVVAWGNMLGGKRFEAQYRAAAKICAAQEAYCPGINKSGQPKHPLYLPNAAELVRWKIPDAFKE